MRLRGPAAVLVVAALPLGACLRAHDSRQPVERTVSPPAAATAGPPATAPAAVPAPALERPPALAPAATVDFASQVRPVLAARCRPCHFAGGTMYEKLPFDDPATVRHLGERLFTRIKAADEQALIRAFLAQEAHGG